MDYNNRLVCTLDNEGNESARDGVESLGQELFTGVAAQQNQQGGQIEQIQYNFQSNTDLLNNIMSSNTEMTGQNLGGSRDMNTSLDMLSMHPSAGGQVPIVAPPQHPTAMMPNMMSQDMTAFGGVQDNLQNQHYETLNPTFLQQLHAQQLQYQQMQQQQQMQQSSEHQQQIIQAHHAFFNQQLRMMGMQQPNQTTRFQQDPLLLGNMLHHNRGGAMPQGAIGQQQIPPEAHSLFASHQILRQMAQLGNPLAPLSSRQSRIIDPEEELHAAVSKGIIEPFPEKLHRLLMEVEKNEQEEIISWTSDGKAFEIHKPDRFFREIVPKYFKQSRLSSFKRQLNLYGFELIASGPSRGGYFHKDFLKDKPEMCRQIRRRDIKFNSRPKSNKWETIAPDFYNMPPITTSDDAKQEPTTSSNTSKDEAEEAVTKTTSSA